jgi:transcriptional regulator with XRE-family HTH domain
MDLKRIIANNIYILRNKLDLTQQEFVDKLNLDISRSQLSNIENGVHMPSAEFIKAVSDTYGVDTNWILSAHNKEYPDLVVADEELEILIKLRQVSIEAQDNIKNLIELLYKNNA